ncbi:MAG: hypothetical protein JST02_15620 [Bacteroidetes bacterium]|nr:hypothetical protein [Bacteroidota bacterium]
MRKEEPLSGEQSMQIIHQMISQAKNNYSENGVSWLLWGILLFLASMSTYIFIDIKASDIFMGWNIFGVASIILLLYRVFSKPLKKQVKTYVDDLMKMVDLGFIACMGIVILAININAVSPRAGFCFLLMLFAFLMIIKGGAIRSRSLQVGAVVNWLGALGILLVPEFKHVMLIVAAAVLTGYIIPGILLMRKYKTTNK